MNNYIVYSLMTGKGWTFRAYVERGADAAEFERRKTEAEKAVTAAYQRQADAEYSLKERLRAWDRN